MAPGVISYPTLLWALCGTALCSASANTINQVGLALVLQSWVPLYAGVLVPTDVLFVVAQLYSPSFMTVL